MTLYTARTTTGPVTGTRSQYMSVCILAALMQGLDGFTVEMENMKGEQT